MTADYQPMRPLHVPEPAEPVIVDRSRWSPRTHRAIVTVWLLTMAVAAVRVLAGESFWLVDRCLPTLFWFFLGSVFFHAAIAYDEWRGQPAWGFTAFVAVIALWLAAGVGLVLQAREDVVTTASADGRLTAAVVKARDVPKAAWSVRVHQNGGLLSRYWSAGCVGGDGHKFLSIRWVDDAVIEVAVSGGAPVRVTLAADGRPLDRVGPGDKDCD